MPHRFSNSLGSVIWFVRLWLSVALLVAMLVLLEMTFLAVSGYRYRPKEHIEHICLRDLSVVDSKNRAGIFCYRQRDASKPIWSQLELCDGDDNEKKLRLPNIDPHRVALSQNKKLAVSTSEGAIHLWQLPDVPLEAEKQLLPPVLGRVDSKTIDSLTFSPDGRFLACSSAEDINVWNANSREKINRFQQERLLAFFPDSNRLLTTKPGLLRVRDLRFLGRISDMQLDDEDQIVAGAISPDSRSVLLSNIRGELFAWSLEQHGLLWKKHSTPLPRAMAISDKLAVFVEKNGTDIVLCDSKTGEEPRVAMQHDCQVHGLALAGRGKLYAWDIHGRLRSIDLADYECSHSSCSEEVSNSSENMQIAQAGFR